MPATAPAVQAGRVDDESDQLQLRLFRRVGAMRGTPPERALWRELLDLAIGHRAAVCAPDGRSVDAAALWAIGWTLYALGNSAGIISGVNIATVARYCRLSTRHVKAARAILRDWRVIKVERPSRRQPEVVKLNLGGLDWPAVRRRAAAERRRLKHASGDTTSPLDPPSGDTMALLDPMSGDTTSPPKGCTERDSSSSSSCCGSTTLPTDRQLRGILSMGNELRAAGLDPRGSEAPQTRVEADTTFRERKRQVTLLREQERKRRSGRGDRRLERSSGSITRRIRNCPSCGALDRNADCHCVSCGWRESGCTCEFEVEASDTPLLPSTGRAR